MEANKKEAKAVQVEAVLLLILLAVTSPVLGGSVGGCPPNGGRGCKGCIVTQMNTNCPTCSPMLHCMAQCLWVGTSRPNCINKCDTNTSYPTLSDCKRCMSKCKCSCIN